MSDTKTITITTDNAVVSISGHLADASGTKTIVEQTPAGNRILGSLVPTRFADARGSNFAKTMVLARGTYPIGAARSPGDIYVTNAAGDFEPMTNISVTIAAGG